MIASAPDGTEPIYISPPRGFSPAGNLTQANPPYFGIDRTGDDGPARGTTSGPTIP